MFENLKKISGKVDALVNTVKSSNQIQTNFELNKILSEHANMLDSRKTKNDYSEEKMRILVDDEFNVLILFSWKLPTKEIILFYLYIR